MFIQVITGLVSDVDGLQAALDRWEQDMRPGATGFLGSTSGVTAEGRFVSLARFESEEAARANSDRPEQGAWWAEAQSHFSGPVTFRDCTEIDIYRGGSDAAGFVQVMEGNADRAVLRAIDGRAEALLAEHRPDLLGTVRAWDGDHYTEAAYFRSEAEARAAEAQEPPPGLADELAAWQAAMGEITYSDLAPPRLT